MNYIVDFDVFEAASYFVGNNDLREYINGIHLCKNRVEATNGHIGYMAKVKNGRELPKQIKGSQLLPDVIVRTKNKIPTKTRKNNFIYCSFTFDSNPRVEYLDFYGNVLAMDSIETIDAKYPNLAKLFASHHRQEVEFGNFGIQAEYLAIFAKILKRQSFKAVIFNAKSSSKSVLCSFNRNSLIDVKEQVLMMPVRL